MSVFDCSIADGFGDWVLLLEEVSAASRQELDILRYWEAKAPVPDGFDVFLCHNGKDKPSVRKLYQQLVSKGVKPWFDEEHLAPGTVWQDELQATIPRIRTVAVIVGPNGKGPWQDMELRAFLGEFANRGCRVIPVILADAPSVPELPLFLRQFTWVDFRRAESSPLDRLLWGIKGKRPA
jgi:diadenosine tetraphosphatase ApaH/serine/threonine PP2A family protein phosphatase